MSGEIRPSLPARRSSELQLAGLRKQFGAVAAIDGVDLEVKAGEFLTLLGSSGSGKSTTLMVVAGFTTPTAGKVLVNGQDQTATPPHKRDIGLVFQDYALFPHLDVSRNIAFSLEMRKVGKNEIAQRVAKALSLVRLEGFGSRRPAELSGGQQQRVALARALVYEPSILLLDEPLGALDKNLREEMQVEIRRIQQLLGITTISVTHDQHEALTMSDRIAVMRAGRIEQVGTPFEVYERPRTRFVAEFMGASNFIRGRALQPPSGSRYLEVETSSGTVLLEKTGGAVPTGVVDVVIRPERLFLAAIGAPPGNQWKAQVTQVTYTGDAWKLGLLLEEGGTLVMSHANNGGAVPQPGEAIAVGVDPAAAWAISVQE